jgi:DNA-binding PadR family transcriptional regulator
MERRGWLRASEPARSKAARIYRLTPRGHDVLNQLLASLDELYGEVGGHRESPRASRPQKPHARARRTA